MNNEIAAGIAKIQLRKDEGLRLKPYLCTADKWTIGYGRNLTDKGVSLYEAEAMLENDIVDVQQALTNDFPWWLTLDHERAAVLINMGFQLGRDGLRDFRRFLRAIEQRRWDEAAKEMLDSKWAKSDSPNRAHRLAVKMREGR